MNNNVQKKSLILIPTLLVQDELLLQVFKPTRATLALSRTALFASVGLATTTTEAVLTLVFILHSLVLRHQRRIANHQHRFHLVDEISSVGGLFFRDVFSNSPRRFCHVSAHFWALLGPVWGAGVQTIATYRISAFPSQDATEYVMKRHFPNGSFTYLCAKERSSGSLRIGFVSQATIRAIGATPKLTFCITKSTKDVTHFRFTLPYRSSLILLDIKHGSLHEYNFLIISHKSVFSSYLFDLQICSGLSS